MAQHFRPEFARTMTGVSVSGPDSDGAEVERMGRRRRGEFSRSARSFTRTVGFLLLTFSSRVRQQRPMACFFSIRSAKKPCSSTHFAAVRRSSRDFRLYLSIDLMNGAHCGAPPGRRGDPSVLPTPLGPIIMRGSWARHVLTHVVVELLPAAHGLRQGATPRTGPIGFCLADDGYGVELGDDLDRRR